MKLIVRNRFIDLAAPIFMSEEQRDKFIDFMKNAFEDVDIKEVQEKYNLSNAAVQALHDGIMQKK